MELTLNKTIGQLRALPVEIENEKYVLLVYSSDFEIDPFYDMFYFPKDTLKMAKKLCTLLSNINIIYM